MEVILLEKIRNLGNLGDQVRVKAGYARNFLIPYGHAVVANEENKAKFEARRAELERLQAGALDQARGRAEKLTGAAVRLVRKASEEGKLFGSVGTKDIADALVEAGFEIHRSEIHLSTGPIKDIGDYEVGVSLHPDVNFTIKVSVAGEAA